MQIDLYVQAHMSSVLLCLSLTDHSHVQVYASCDFSMHYSAFNINITVGFVHAKHTIKSQRMIWNEIEAFNSSMVTVHLHDIQLSDKLRQLH